MDLDQTLRKDDDRDGRSSAAKLIKAAQANGGRNWVKAHFAVGDLVKTPAAREGERDATARAERLISNLHVSLDNPDGSALRKGGRVLDTVLDVIRKVHSGGPKRLVKGIGLPPQSSNTRWDDNRSNDGAELAHVVVEQDRQRAGVRPPQPTLGSPPHSASIRVGRPPPQDEDATVEAIKEAHRNPRPLWG